MENLLQEILSLQNEITHLEENVCAKAIVLGERLEELKMTVHHGDWLPTLKKIGMHERTAQRNMAYHKHRELLNTTNESDLKK